MTRLTRLTVTFSLLAAGCASTPPPRQNDARKPAPRTEAATVTSRTEAPPSRPYGTVDIDADAAPVASILADVARQMDRPIVLLGACEERLTFSIRRAPWRDVLDYVARRAKLAERRQGQIIIFEAKPRTTLQAQDADKAAWVRVLAAGAGKSVVMPGHLEGDVTAELHDVSYEEALKATVDSSAYEIVNEGD